MASPKRSRVRDELRAALAPGVPIVVADMSRTVLCDSAFCRYLLIVHHLAVASRAELRIVTDSPGVLRVLKATGADRILTIYPALRAALTAVPARVPQPP